jgi:Putative mono-oxygenase ydhR
MSAKILQISFKFRGTTADYQNLCQSVAEAFATLPGLRWKIWLLNEQEKEGGGIYLFESDQAVNDYLTGPLVAQVKSHPALYDLNAKLFDVLADVTAITRGPVPAVAAFVTA